WCLLRDSANAHESSFAVAVEGHSRTLAQSSIAFRRSCNLGINHLVIEAVDALDDLRADSWRESRFRNRPRQSPPEQAPSPTRRCDAPRGRRSAWSLRSRGRPEVPATPGLAPIAPGRSSRKPPFLLPS